MGLKAFYLWFYLCTGQVRPKIQRLRVRATIVRWYVRNTVESPCGKPSSSSTSFLSLSLSVCLYLFFAFSSHLSPLPRSLSLILVLQEDGQADPSIRTAAPHCSQMVQLAGSPYSRHTSMSARVRVCSLCVRLTYVAFDDDA